MRKEDFTKLKYFSYDEKNHRGEYLFHNEEVLKNTDFSILKTLDELRKFLKEPIVILCTWEKSGHSPNSQHYKIPCKAVDFRVLSDKHNFYKTTLRIIDGLNKVTEFDKCGFGFYPYGNSFHLDLRGEKARWCGLHQIKDGKPYIDYIKFEDGITLIRKMYMGV